MISSTRVMISERSEWREELRGTENLQDSRLISLATGGGSKENEERGSQG